MSVADFIQRCQRQWFERVRPYLAENNLNVGSGLGYFSRYAEEDGVPMSSLEIAQHPGALPLRDFALYDGRHMPFENGTFDVSIAMYVLHHTPDNRVVLSEMKRVSTKRIILVEELYNGLFGKIRLVVLDIWINFLLRQISPIHWRSYFSKQAFRSAVEGDGWKIIQLESTSRGGFDEVLCVLESQVS
jgi:SAM-dependent methyltransferase